MRLLENMGARNALKRRKAEIYEEHWKIRIKRIKQESEEVEEEKEQGIGLQTSYDEQSSSSSESDAPDARIMEIGAEVEREFKFLEGELNDTLI